MDTFEKNGDFCIIPSEYFKKLLDNKPKVTQRQFYSGNSTNWTSLFIILTLFFLFVSFGSYSSEKINIFDEIENFIVKSISSKFMRIEEKIMNIESTLNNLQQESTNEEEIEEEKEEE